MLYKAFQIEIVKAPAHVGTLGMGNTATGVRHHVAGTAEG
jgi:hypothetical protein